MKKTLLALLTAAVFTPAAQAQSTLYWAGTTTGNVTTTWDTTTTQWSTTSGGSASTTWQSGDIADFSANPTGVVTVNTNGTINAAGLVFSNTTTGYYVGSVTDSAGGAFNILGNLNGNNGNAMTGTYTGASSYNVLGAAGHSSFGSNAGMQFRGGKFDNNIVIGTGTDFGDVGAYGYGGTTVSLFTTTGKSITVNNGWNFFVNSGGNASFTDTLNLNGLGAGNGSGGALVLASNETWSGTINLQSDSAITSGGSTYLTKITGPITGSGNLYLGYATVQGVTAGDGLVVASTANTSTGNTILFTSFNGLPNTASNGSGTTLPTTSQAIQLGANNALSQKALVLGETANTITTLGDGTTITPANYTVSTYNATTHTGGGSYQSANGALDMNSYGQQVSGLVVGGTQTGANQIIFNSATGTTSTLTINGNTTNMTTGFAGTIEDNTGSGGKVAVTMAGGAAKLSGANTYTGGTSVTGGTLTAGVASTSTTGAFGGPTGAVTVSGGKLDANNFTQTVGAVSLSGTGQFSLGITTTGLGTSDTVSGTTATWAGGSSAFTLDLGTTYVTSSALTFSSTLTESGSGPYTFNLFDGVVGQTYDLLTATNMTTLGDGNFASNGDTGTFGLSGNTLTFEVTGVVAAPEPSTWALMLLGVGALGFVRRARAGARS